MDGVGGHYGLVRGDMRPASAYRLALSETGPPDESPARDHRDAGRPRDERARRPDLFQEYEDRQRRHPGEIHHAHDEEDAHQRPAAAEAVRPVLDPHAQRPRVPIPPVGHEKSERASAVRQASTIEGCKLIDARGDQDGAAESSAGRRHRR